MSRVYLGDGNIVGFGKYHYKYESGREDDWFLTGFAPRKGKLSIYIMPGIDKYRDLLEKIDKYSTGQSYLYVKKLEDIEIDVLRDLLKQSVEFMRGRYQG